MLFRFLSVAAAAASLGAGVLGPGAAPAETIGEVGGPVNPPPASFRGTQFVDARGCVFMRAGYAGSVQWVPRAHRNRQVLCGYQPTRVGGAVPVAVAPVAVAPVAVAAAPAPVVTAPRVAVVAAPMPRQIVHRPVTPRVATPRYVAPRVVVAAPVRRVPVETLPAGTATAEGVVVPDARYVPVPPGYKIAWDDDRLNPMRGHGTAAGEAQMDQVWTRTVPRRLIQRQVKTTGPVTIVRVPRGYRLSTSNGPDTGTPVQGRYVQAGSFAAPGNASRAAARLRQAGLPVVMAGQGRLKVVLAGPFTAPEATSAALSTVRQTGFPDAFARD